MIYLFKDIKSYSALIEFVFRPIMAVSLVTTISLSNISFGMLNPIVSPLILLFGILPPFFAALNRTERDYIKEIDVLEKEIVRLKKLNKNGGRK